jgi:glycosyltransferase involved in cell wall biosynthesis
VYWTPHYNLPLFARTQRLVVTVQDVCHLALPEMTGGPVRRAYARLMLDQVRRRAHGVLFSSHFSRREMERLVGAPSAPTAVSPLAVSGEWWNTKDQSFRLMDGPYFVYVGNFKRHKNIPALLSGFRQVADRIPHSLVLIGRSKGLRVDPAVQQALAGLERRVLLAGEVDDVTLRAYVAHATAFVTASLYEGFGLPPLEAMAAGCPCVVSNAASLPEVCGDAALYCDPRDASSIAARLLEIATNDSARACLIGKGRERARQFTWKRCAEDTVALLEQTLA